MIVKIAVKSAAKRRNIEYRDYELPAVKNLQELIGALVDCEINRYEQDELKVLSQTDIDTMLEQGKVTFGFKYREDVVIDRNEAKRTAIEAFNDGLFVVFINDKQIEDINEALSLKNNDVIVLVRLTMLAGRCF